MINLVKKDDKMSKFLTKVQILWNFTIYSYIVHSSLLKNKEKNLFV